MSLREKLEQQKALKAQERERAAAAESATAEQHERSEAQAALQDLAQRFDSLSGIRAAVREATDRMRESRARLKRERTTLRELHADSMDEESGEAMLPKPVELLRDESFAQEDEVVSYREARDAFQLSAEQVKAVRGQLSALGIENPESLLPGQLNALLQDAEKTVEREVREFLQERPGTDPETEARLFEAIVQKKTEVLYQAISSAMPSRAHKQFEQEFRSVIKDKKQSGAFARRPYFAALAAGAEEAVRGGLDKAAAVEAFQRNRLDPAAPVDELDRAALERALALTIALGDPRMPMGDERMAAVIDADKKQQFEENSLKEEPRPLVPIDQLPEAERDAARRERQGYLAERGAVSQDIRQLSQTVLSGVEDVRGLERAVAELKELEVREREISRTLEEGEESVRERLAAAKRDADRAERQERAAADRETQLAEGFKNLPSMANLPPYAYDAAVTAEKSTWGEKKFSISGKDLYRYPQPSISELTRMLDDANRLAESAAAAAGMKNGLLGMSREKKEKIASVTGSLERQFGRKVSTLEEAQATLAALTRELSDSRQDAERMVADNQRLSEALEPLSGLLEPLELTGYSGSLRGLIDQVLRSKSTALIEAARKRAEAAEHAQKAREARDELAEKEHALRGELRALGYKKQRVREEEDRLRQNAESKGSIRYQRS